MAEELSKGPSGMSALRRFATFIARDERAQSVPGLVATLLMGHPVWYQTAAQVLRQA